MDLDLLFLGTAGSVPSARRGLPAILVRRGGDALLFDCGEGTQRQLLRSSGLMDLGHVFITHLHADHVLGLPGMVKSFSLRGRERPLTVYGPPGLSALFDVLGPVIGRTSFELSLVELQANEPVELDGYLVAPFAVDHGVRAYGFALVEHERPGRFDEARARELGVAPGADFGRLQRGEAVGGVEPAEVLGASRRGRKLVITGDTRPSETTRAVAHEADVLVHEATFGADGAARAKETRHSTAAEAAGVAVEAGVTLLALTHISPRYAGPELRDEARAIFERTIVPRDLDRVEVPLPERGEPVHVRAGEARTCQPAPAPAT